jgi:glycosyltransferase involved in cell wall biosynthesis
MAFGLPAVVTRWRAVPEFIPEGYAGLIEPRQPGQVAAALLALLTEDGARFRDVFLTHFTLDTHLKALAAAIRTCDG